LFDLRARSDEDHKTHRELRHQLPIEEKESYRWLEGYRRACELAGLGPRLVISMADREADIYEIYLEWFNSNARARLERIGSFGAIRIGKSMTTR